MAGPVPQSICEFSRIGTSRHRLANRPRAPLSQRKNQLFWCGWPSDMRTQAPNMGPGVPHAMPPRSPGRFSGTRAHQAANPAHDLEGVACLLLVGKLARDAPLQRVAPVPVIHRGGAWRHPQVVGHVQLKPANGFDRIDQRWLGGWLGGWLGAWFGTRPGGRLGTRFQIFPARAGHVGSSLAGGDPANRLPWPRD